MTPDPQSGESKNFELKNGDLKNGVPIIDRMMEILGVLEARPAGATILEVTRSLGVPRSTVYRVLNTLEHHGVVVRHNGAGAYVLGPRLAMLAAHRAERPGVDLEELCTPHLRALTRRMGEASKISVTDGERVQVICRVDGEKAYGLSINRVRTLPLHAGAAGKLLLAYLDEPAQARVLARPLDAFTPRTPTDPGRLRTELRAIRRQGWASDRGEYTPLVHAFAAPVLDGTGAVLGAVSMPFLGGRPRPEMDAIRAAVVGSAADMSAAVAAIQNGAQQGGAQPDPRKAAARVSA